MFEALGRCLRAYAEKDGRGYPDWAVRYVPVIRRLGSRTAAAGRILEIGANENGFARFSGAPVTAVDIALEHLRAARGVQPVTPVLADMTALPFADDTFGLCVCMDTFEHLPRERRAPAVAELARVLRRDGTAVIGFPAGVEAERAEAVVRAAYRRYTGRALGWLEEHVAVGLPDAAELARRFEEAAGSTHHVACCGNVPLWVWRRMWLVLMCGWPGRGNAAFQALLRLITPLLCRLGGNRCYRTLIWLEPK